MKMILDSGTNFGDVTVEAIHSAGGSRLSIEQPNDDEADDFIILSPDRVDAFIVTIQEVKKMLLADGAAKA